MAFIDVISGGSPSLPSRLVGSGERRAGVKVTLRAAMAEDMKLKLCRYKTAPFDSRFPNQNQTRNCWQNYLDFQRCQRAVDACGADATIVPSVSPMSPLVSPMSPCVPRFPAVPARHGRPRRRCHPVPVVLPRVQVPVPDLVGDGVGRGP
ncbi:uncharacterized protein LOC132085995 isoform X1 [Ammospiza nelsoni]|uniref:uncharacterized protein LOC132085995 isoform X1 n=2 Tax=Ammospiza nelsoni TaxID=2857394 RepID=UPI00286A68DD|nr:uncharacterized protein LOC132085995 isoform X1 [Ammospiza nelsoni]